MELVMKLHVFCKANEIPYKIKYLSDAICWSQAPEKLKDLIKQRKRWHIGLFQSMKKYKELFANTKYGLISFISFLYFLLYELLSPIIELIGIITIIVSYFVNLINLPFMILFLILYALFGAILSFTIFLARIYVEENKTTFKDVLEHDVDEMDLGKIVVVADNGMNTQENKYLLVNKGNGYIVSRLRLAINLGNIVNGIANNEKNGCLISFSLSFILLNVSVSKRT